jgi:putative SOS response-associated peptidase YedK
MCTHYRLQHDFELIEFASQMAHEDVFDEHDGNESWNPVAEARPWDSVKLPVVYQLEAGNTLGFLRWGVWPFYAQERPKNFSLSCNARDDALLSKPIWRQAAAHGRCLVPADGFFEWAGPKGAKWEVLFHLPGEEPFFFAGLWSRDPAGTGRGFALVTTTPNQTVAALPHDRMPVILDRDSAIQWIGREPLPGDELRALCCPYSGELVRVDQPRPAKIRGKTTRADDATDEPLLLE